MAVFVCGVMLLSGIAITLVIEVPINKQIASWIPGTISGNWMELRERWLLFHYLRSFAGVIAFICVLAGAIERQQMHF